MFKARNNTTLIIQIFTSILSAIGLFYFDFTTANILITIFSFYIYSSLGIALTLHRYYSHKSFEFKNSVFKYIFTVIAVLAGRGSPLGWVYVHREHHAFSDTKNDPHAPSVIGLKVFGFKHVPNKIKIFLIKDVITKEQMFIDNYYFAIILCWICVLTFINPSLLYFAWILPVMFVQITQNIANYVNHTAGYRNFNTRDNSTNNIWLWPFILGEAWHNNHHYNPSLISNKIKTWEFDPAAYIVKFIQK
jgi:fatty-acid desaturase